MRKKFILNIIICSLLTLVYTSCSKKKELSFKKLFQDKSTIISSHHSGSYIDSILNIRIKASFTDSILIQSIDSSYAIYNDTAIIKLRQRVPKISMIPTTFLDSDSERTKWNKPQGKFSSFHDIKIYSYNKGEIDDSLNLIIVLGCSEFDSLPIVSLIVDKNNLFSLDSGIYVSGSDYIQSNRKSLNYFKFKSKKIPGIITLIDSNKIYLSDNIKMKIHGLNSPMSPQKTLRVYLDKKNHVNEIFDLDRNVSKLLLRSSYSGWGHRLMVDGWIMNVCKDMNITVMPYKPIKVYVNGEYWGIHGLREHTDLKMISNITGIKKKKLIYSDDKGFNKDRGEFVEYGAVIDSILNNPGYPYSSVSSVINIDSYVDWLAAEIFFQNYDWPLNNSYFWKIKDSGKWNSSLIDMDGSVGRPYHNWFEFSIKDRSPKRGHIILTYLFQQKEFQKLFINRSLFLLETKFSSENLSKEFNKIVSQINPNMEEHYRRWHDGDIDKYEDSIEHINDFIEKRPEKYLEHMYEFFDEING